jgi:hypothetical protein
MTFAAFTVFRENSLALRVAVLETASINASRCESKSALPLFPALYKIAYSITKKITLVFVAIRSIPFSFSILFAVLELSFKDYFVESVFDSAVAL